MNKTRVYFQIVTDESAENGDIAESGIISEGETLREALKDVSRTRTNLVAGYSLQCESTYNGLCVTVDNDMEWETGERESRTLFVECTKASAGRLVRLIERR